MQQFNRTMVIAAGLLGAGRGVAQSPVPTAGPGVTAFVNVSVVPMDRERVLAGQTVVVRGDRIVALGSASKVRVPAGAARVDGRGKYLIPGLADMHVHLGYVPLLAKASDSTVEKALFLYLANGITTVRDMHSGADPAAPTRALGLKRRVEAGTLVGPRIYTAGDPDESSPAAAARTTAKLKRDGYDFIKISFDARWPAPQALYDSILTTAHRVGLRVVGHVPPGLPLRDLLAAHWASTEHLYEYPEYLLGLSGRWSLGDGGIMANIKPAYADTAVWMRPGYRLDAGKLRALAAAVRRAGVWNCPTLAVNEVWYDGVMQRGQKDTAVRNALRREGVEPRVLGRFNAFNRQITKALQDAGAGLLLGTDATDTSDPRVPGFAVHQELGFLVKAGLTPYQALATGTRNVAAFLGTLDSTGTVAVGKRADLVLLGANPLRDVGATRRLAGVMRGGAWFSRAAIDSTLDAWQPSFTPNDFKTLRKARETVWQY